MQAKLTSYFKTLTSENLQEDGINEQFNLILSINEISP